ATASIRLINTIGERLESLGFARPDLRADHLLHRAQKRTGLNDWGDATFLSGLEQLTAALQSEARLSQVGRIIAYWSLLDLLCVRLRLNAYRTARPEVAEQPIKRPLFILGLPRTG